MKDHPPLSAGRQRAVPRAFSVYAAATAVVAGLLLAALVWQLPWQARPVGLYVLLAAFVVAGELLPIPVPRRNDLAMVTVSTAFAFAILLRFGLAPALLPYVLSVVIADALDRVAPIKALFNAAQYALAMIAAAGVLALTQAHPPLANLSAGEVPAILAAGVAFFVVNHLLACAGAALLAGLPIPRYIRDDLSFQAWTAGCVLAFAPAVVASAHSTLALVPVCFVPMLAVYIGGRQAVLNTHRAYHDSLTDLPNRTLLTDMLKTRISAARRDGGAVSVMMLDVDDFKAINDTLGHEFGDSVLKQIALRLQDALAPGVLARLGGDEFAVILDGDATVAEQSAQRLLAALDEPVDVEWLGLPVAASIGIASFPRHGRNVDELLRHADVALYCAKGSDVSFQTYAEEYDEYSIDRISLAAQLRRGIERGELKVHYQPKAPLKGGPITAVEVLARWDHPQLGWIGPDGFIPLAEQTGVIKPLTERVLEQALAQCAAWRSEGLEVTISVNVSWRSLLDHELPAMIRRLLDRHQVPASMLQLEITESRIVADLRRGCSALEALRGLGLKIAIDDFGTGFSSLSQLQHLPIDEIKIDRSFVTRMEANRSDAVLVRSIIELGRNLGLTVTAEGIETESVKATLRELGCDFGQGFCIGRAVAAEECRRYLGGPAEPHPRPRLVAAGGTQ
ncbi:MAG: putative bifunctional diguanylate cyclase/phosphodiesterase [Candidatus Woesearchaeota archaeon]